MFFRLCWRAPRTLILLMAMKDFGIAIAKKVPFEGGSGGLQPGEMDCHLIWL
jgi:hypothetical protein